MSTCFYTLYSPLIIFGGYFYDTSQSLILIYFLFYISLKYPVLAAAPDIITRHVFSYYILLMPSYIYYLIFYSHIIILKFYPYVSYCISNDFLLFLKNDDLLSLSSIPMSAIIISYFVPYLYLPKFLNSPTSIIFSNFIFPFFLVTTCPRCSSRH